MSSMEGWASVPTGNDPIGVSPQGPVARRGRRRVAGAAITAIVAASLASGAAAPAYASLIGPVSPTLSQGFPVSYSDGNIALGQCLTGAQCLPGAPVERFYFAATAATVDQPALYEAALEATYLNAPATTAGEEILFARIRVRLGNVVPFATYRIQHPYGDFEVVESGPLDNNKGRTDQLSVTLDVGCLDVPCGATGFAKAAADFIGNSANPTTRFLTQNNPAAGSIGDLLAPGPVGGATHVDALGQPMNKIIVTGPKAGGPTSDTLTVTDFSVQGALVGAPVAPSAISVPTFTNGPSPLVKWQTPANGGSPVTAYSVQAVDPITGALVGAPRPAAPTVGTSSNSLSVTGLTAGTKVAFQVTATNAAGTSIASVRSATVIPGTQTQRYVARVYYDLFNRAPDATGLAGWTNRLDAFTPRAAVANAITSSGEYRSKLIAGSYAHYLLRAPDAGGLSANLAAMARGMTISQMEAGFIASPEYFLKAGSTNAKWVSKLYADVLGRAASPLEVSNWVALLNRGRTRSQVAIGFLLSSERLTTVVNGYYQQLLGRNLDASGKASTVAFLQRGGRNEVIIGGIIGSSEYFSKS